MKRRLLIIISLILVTAVLFGACGKNEETADYAAEKAESKQSMPEPGYDRDDSAEDYGEAMEAEEHMAPEESSDVLDNLAMNDTSTGTETVADDILAGKADQRKYILTYYYEMETLEFEETEQKLIDMVEFHFGFFESSQSSGRSINESYQRRRGIYTIRIPKEKIHDFTEGLSGIGNILDSNSNVENVTSQYTDYQARIKTLSIQEERLLAILEKAEDLEYIIELERELADVRYQIERHQTNFRSLEDQINYSTVHVTLYEVFEETDVKEPPKTFTEKLVSGFTDTVEDLAEFIENLTLFLLTKSPIILIYVIIGFIIYRIIRRYMKKTEKEISRNMGKTGEEDSSKKDENH